MQIERDIRELAQSIATLEVVLVGFMLLQLENRPQARRSFVARLTAFADRAVFQRDGLEPKMLDRIVEKLT